MFKIQIPKPCHEDWTKMTPTEKGAFCKSCTKEVVDFTKMTDAEVKNFLNKTHGICGRFNAEQIHRVTIELPPYIFYRKIPDWKKYFAIILLAFGSMLFGCDVNTPQKHTTTVKLDRSLDTFNDAKKCRIIVGDAIVGDTIDAAQQKIVGFTSPKIIENKKLVLPSNVTMGEPAFIPVSSTDSKPLQKVLRITTTDTSTASSLDSVKD